LAGEERGVKSSISDAREWLCAMRFERVASIDRAFSALTREFASRSPSSPLYPTRNIVNGTFAGRRRAGRINSQRHRLKPAAGEGEEGEAPAPRNDYVITG